MKSFVLPHKISRAAAAAVALILVGLAFAACGGRGGHSAAYKAGYDWAIQDVDSLFPKTDIAPPQGPAITPVVTPQPEPPAWVPRLYPGGPPLNPKG